jgi:hypothetical protein
MIRTRSFLYAPEPASSAGVATALAGLIALRLPARRRVW